jgi:hypothetical protein
VGAGKPREQKIPFPAEAISLDSVRAIDLCFGAGIGKGSFFFELSGCYCKFYDPLRHPRLVP